LWQNQYLNAALQTLSHSAHLQAWAAEFQQTGRVEMVATAFENEGVEKLRLFAKMSTEELLSRLDSPLMRFQSSRECHLLSRQSSK